MVMKETSIGITSVMSNVQFYVIMSQSILCVCFHISMVCVCVCVHACVRACVCQGCAHSGQ